MNVFVLTEEPYHDNSSLLGVFSSLEKAQVAAPGEWYIPDEATQKACGASSENRMWWIGDGEYLIREVTIDRG